MITGLAFDDQVRTVALDCTDLVQEAHERHDTWSNASAALGRTLAGTLLLASNIGPDDLMTVVIDGDGPLGRILTTANGKGQIKGYVSNPHVSLDLNDKGKIDVRGAVGSQGVFSVTKDLGLGQPFTGQVPIVSGEIAEDFTYYLSVSEQIPSAMGLGVLVDTDENILHAGGWMVQLLPDTDDQVIDQLEADIREMPQVTDALQAGDSPEDMLYRLLGRDQVRLLDEKPVNFHCGCSKERFARGLATLSDQDFSEMIEEDHGAETVCYFCNGKYYYTEEELREIQAYAHSRRQSRIKTNDN